MKIINFSFLLAVIILFNACKKQVGSSNINPSAIADTTSYPPYQWKEHWGHEELLTRVYFDSTLVVYYDKDVNREVAWPFAFLGKVWAYTRQTYGDYGGQAGKDNRLYGIFHTDKYGGGHPASYFDETHDYRNVIDLGEEGGIDAWKYAEGWNIGASIHEIGHIVEGASNGVNGSPAFGIWGDSKWAEIFVYDVYRGIGMQREAAYTRDECLDVSDTYPAYASQWFRDWYLPIYEKYGGNKVLANYFKLLAANFPKFPVADKLYKFEERDITWGEYIHFMSSAAGVNLQPMAAKAFGWPAAWTYLLQNAKQQFPAITYSGINDPLVTPEPDIDITASGLLTVSNEHPDGLYADQGSLKLVDNNIETKFFTGFTPGFCATLQFVTPQKANSYSITTGNDFEGRDPKDFELLGSNDNSYWTTLDVQTYKKFTNRKGSYRFRFTNNTSYKFYRLKIRTVRTAPDLQLSEWKLWTGGY